MCGGSDGEHKKKKQKKNNTTPDANTPEENVAGHQAVRAVAAATLCPPQPPLPLHPIYHVQVSHGLLPLHTSLCAILVLEVLPARP